MITGPCAEVLLEAVEVRAGRSALQLETVQDHTGVIVARATFDHEGEEVQLYKHNGRDGFEAGALTEFWAEEWPPVNLS